MADVETGRNGEAAGDGAPPGPSGAPVHPSAGRPGGPDPADRAARARRDRRLVAFAAIGLIVVLFWLTPLRGRSEPPEAPTATTGVTPIQPLPPPVTAPERLSPPPRAGSVAVQPGPFDSRVALSGLAFTRAPTTGVTGTARVLGREEGTATIGLRVDFYDARGARVGGAVQVLRQPAAFARDPSGARRPYPFAISARDPIPGAAAARVSVTLLALS